jgi:hypothetical protein
MDMTNGYDHELNPVKGWFSPYSLDKSVPQASGNADIVMGSVCSLNATGRLVAGLAVNAMPLYAFSTTSGFTGAGPAGKMANMSEHMTGRFYNAAAPAAGSQIQSAPARVVMCLVGIGSYELETTEFVAGSYPSNTALTSPIPGAANAGKLVAGTFFTDTICGMVSDGTAVNNYSKSVIRFWPVFVPATPASV